MARKKGTKKTGGRKAGTPNKTTALLKDAILQAGELAGGEEGLTGYLLMQAKLNPAPFMTLLGKVLPTQLTGDPENPIHQRIDSDAKFGAVVDALELSARAKQGGTSGESEVDQQRPPATTDT